MLQDCVQVLNKHKVEARTKHRSIKNQVNFFLSGGSEPRTAAPVAVACAPFTCKSAYSSGQKRNVNLQKRKFALAETTLNFHKKKFHSEIIICCTSHDLDEVSPASNATP